MQFGAASVVTLTTVALTPGVAQAAQSKIYKGFASNKAVSGYDPVAYFAEGKPVKVSKKYRLKFEGPIGISPAKRT